MNARRLFLALAPLCIVVSLTTGALGQSPAPAPSAAPQPAGLVGSGTITIQTQVLNSAISAAMSMSMPSPATSASAAPSPAASAAPTLPPTTIVAGVAFEVRGVKVRFDLQSVTVSGLSAGGAGMVPHLPPGGITAVIDPTAQKVIGWVPATKKYFVGKIPQPSFAATPRPRPSGHATSAPQPFDPFTALRALKNVKAFSIALTGHSTANGHPTSQYDLVLDTMGPKETEFWIRGSLQLADDMDEFPVRWELSARGTKLPETSFREDLTTFERRMPPDADFHPPGGYKLVKNPGEAFK